MPICLLTALPGTSPLNGLPRCSLEGGGVIRLDWGQTKSGHRGGWPVNPIEPPQALYGVGCGMGLDQGRAWSGHRRGWPEIPFNIKLDQGAWHSLQGNETRVNLVGPPERVAGQSVQAATGSLLSGGLKGRSRIRSYLIHPQLIELPRGTIAQWACGYVAGFRRGSDRARQGGCYEVGAMGPDPVAAARGFWSVLGRAGFDPPFLSPTARGIPSGGGWGTFWN